MYFLLFMIIFCLWACFKHNIQKFHFAPTCDCFVLLASVPVTSFFWSFIQQTFIKTGSLVYACVYCV